MWDKIKKIIMYGFSKCDDCGCPFGSNSECLKCDEHKAHVQTW